MDRFILDPATTYDERPTSLGLHALSTAFRVYADAMANVMNRFAESMRPLANLRDRNRYTLAPKEMEES